MTARRADALAVVADALPNAMAVSGDITDDAHRARLVRAVLERYGRLDGLVNNAGSLRVLTAFREDASAFQEMLDVNLLAPFDLARRSALAMREAAAAPSST